MRDRIKLQILSDKIEEELLYESIYSGLWVGKKHHRGCVSVSGFTNFLDGRILDNSTNPDYIRIDISINNQIINFYTHKDIKRGYLHHFYYNSENLFEDGGKLKYSFYLVADDVLDGKPHYTSELMERKLKLQKLINKIQHEKLTIGNTKCDGVILCEDNV